MKKVVLFAIIAALCAGALLYFYLGKLEAQKEVKIEYDNVLVAAADIPAFTPISIEMLTFKQIPKGYAHPQAAHTVEEVVGYVTERDVLAGEEIIPTKLKQFGETDSGLSYVVPEGMRAVTVAVDEISGVAGFLKRGDYVDVLSYTTASVQIEKTEQAADGTQLTTQSTQSVNTTVVAAQNVQVVAIGMSLSAASTDAADNAAAVGYNSVTLLLTPEDAMRVMQGSKSGIIMLILRASGDHAPNTEKPIVNDTLLEQAK
ncbi:MAG: Flp pilus assembly protein CpaB [Clostridiales bacterium]|nr:Flp pilus assembly protein CpaB [Clostridiales bacterium]